MMTLWRCYSVIKLIPLNYFQINKSLASFQKDVGSNENYCKKFMHSKMALKYQKIV